LRLGWQIYVHANPYGFGVILIVIIISIMKEFIVCLLQCAHEHRFITFVNNAKISSEITDKHSQSAEL